jgi:hypothetical protein
MPSDFSGYVGPKEQKENADREAAQAALGGSAGAGPDETVGLRDDPSYVFGGPGDNAGIRLGFLSLFHQEQARASKEWRDAYRTWARKSAQEIMSKKTEDTSWMIEAGFKDMLERGETTIYTGYGGRMGGQTGMSWADLIRSAGEGYTSSTGKFAQNKKQRSQLARMLIPEVEASQAAEIAAINAQTTRAFPTMSSVDAARKIARLARAHAETLRSLKKSADDFDIEELEKESDALRKLVATQMVGGRGGISYAGLWSSIRNLWQQGLKAAEILSKTDAEGGRAAALAAEDEYLSARLDYNRTIDDLNEKDREQAKRDLATVRRMEEIGKGTHAQAMFGGRGRGGGGRTSVNDTGAFPFGLMDPGEMTSASQKILQQQVKNLVGDAPSAIQAGLLKETLAKREGINSMGLPLGLILGSSEALMSTQSGNDMSRKSMGKSMAGLVAKSLGAGGVSQTGMFPGMLDLLQEMGLKDFPSGADLTQEIRESYLDAFWNAKQDLDDAVGEIDKRAHSQDVQDRLTDYLGWEMDIFEADKKKKDKKSNIAREILSTGGISGLAQAGLSQVVSGGYEGRGRVGSPGPFALSGAGAEMIRASSAGEKEKEKTVKLHVFLDKDWKAEVIDQATSDSLQVTVKTIRGAPLGAQAVP